MSLECADVLLEKIEHLGPVELVRRTIRQMQRGIDTAAHDLRTAENAKNEVERQMRLVQATSAAHTVLCRSDALSHTVSHCPFALHDCLPAVDCQSELFSSRDSFATTASHFTLAVSLCLYVQHEVIQATEQREKMSERSKTELDRVRSTEEDLASSLTEIANARMEAAEFGDKEAGLVQIVGSLRKQLREAVNEIGLVQREVVGVQSSPDSVERTVAELVADQRAKLRETEEGLATVTRELQSTQRQWSDVRDQHHGAAERVQTQRDELYHSTQMLDQSREDSEILKSQNTDTLRLLKVNVF